jgi:hypothetical protein
MEGWALFFMIVVLKIPLVAALWIIWYAIKAEPAADEEVDGGSKRGPRRNPPRLPRPPRRPAGGVACRPSPCPQLSHGRARRLPAPARR